MRTLYRPSYSWYLKCEGPGKRYPEKTRPRRFTANLISIQWYNKFSRAGNERPARHGPRMNGKRRPEPQRIVDCIYIGIYNTYSKRPFSENNGANRVPYGTGSFRFSVSCVPRSTKRVPYGTPPRDSFALWRKFPFEITHKRYMIALNCTTHLYRNTIVYTHGCTHYHISDCSDRVVPPDILCPEGQVYRGTQIAYVADEYLCGMLRDNRPGTEPIHYRIAADIPCHIHHASHTGQSDMG